MTSTAWRSTRSLAFVFVLAASSVVAGFGFGRGWKATPPPSRAVIRQGEELVLVFIGASTCGASKLEGVAEAVQAIRRHLQREADGPGITLVSLGVAAEWDVSEGMAFLEPFGRFDEVLVGRGILNTGIVKYVWEDFPGPALYPQVLVIERQVSTRPAYRIDGERVRLRRIGALPIVAWGDALKRGESREGTT